jgi:hypothetical protein
MQGSPNGLGLIIEDRSVILSGFFVDGLLNGYGRVNLDTNDFYEGYLMKGIF